MGSHLQDWQQFGGYDSSQSQKWSISGQNSLSRNLRRTREMY
jgi:hypothetical protein